MPDTQIRLLALDGGGVRGLSSLLILRNLMATVNPDSPPKPCEYFDMIGGTSTGGIIAIMLGRLKMTVDECIEAYTSLSDKVFEKKSKRVSFNGQLQGRFDSNKLEQVIKEILRDRKLDEDELLKDGSTSCKVFVCATSRETSDTVCLTSYRSPRSDNVDLLNSVTIWQACRATSAATTFFDPIAIGPFDEEFVDGALGENNPVYSLWNQAMDVWDNQLLNKLQCLVSVGTGVPSLKPIRDDILGIFVTLRDIATETEKTAQRFHRDKSNLDDEGRYYRFNVDQGLDDIGLQESKKKKEMAAATRRYVDSQTVHKQMRACANNLARRQYHGPYRTAFSLSEVPVSNHFIERPSDTAAIDQCLLPQNFLSQPNRQQQRKIFVLYGLGGIGKTQLAANYARRHQFTFSSVFWLNGRSEDRLKQSLANCAKRIPQGQLPERSKDFDAASKEDLDIVVNDVLAWLAQPDNTDWLLIFDNVDHDQEQGGTTSEFDVRQYLPGDHGSALITTRLSRLAQLGDARQLKKVDQDLSKAIFEQWYGGELVLDEAGRELLHLLDGLPLALAQAAAYCCETGLNAASYIPLYKQQWYDLMKSNASSDLPLTDYHQGSVGTTWTITFKAIEERSESAANLLRFWAYIANKDLWHGLFQRVTDFRRGFPDWLYEMACSQIKFLDTMRLLQRYSMAEAQEDVQGSYSIHPVVHRWASHIQDDTEKITFIELAIIAVGLSVPVHRSTNYWIIERRLLPQAEGFPRWIETILKRGWNPDNQAVLQSIHLLGSLFEDQGRLREAEDMYQRALQGREKAFGLEHPSTLDTMNSLGNIYQSQGQIREAEDMYKRALQGREKALGPEHEATLATVNNLGCLFGTQGRLREAEAMHQRTIQGLEKMFGPEHRSILGAVNNLGILYQRQGRLQEAEAMYQRASRGFEEALGPDHQLTLEAVNNLGILYQRQGRLQEAEAMYQRASRGFEEALGPDHQLTLKTTSRLMVLNENLTRLSENEAAIHESPEPKQSVKGIKGIVMRFKAALKKP